MCRAHAQRSDLGVGLQTFRMRRLHWDHCRKSHTRQIAPRLGTFALQRVLCPEPLESSLLCRRAALAAGRYALALALRSAGYYHQQGQREGVPENARGCHRSVCPGGAHTGRLVCRRDLTENIDLSVMLVDDRDLHIYILSSKWWSLTTVLKHGNTG